MKCFSSFNFPQILNDSLSSHQILADLDTDYLLSEKDVGEKGTVKQEELVPGKLCLSELALKQKDSVVLDNEEVWLGEPLPMFIKELNPALKVDSSNAQRNEVPIELLLIGAPLSLRSPRRSLGDPEGFRAELC